MFYFSTGNTKAFVLFNLLQDKVNKVEKPSPMGFSLYPVVATTATVNDNDVEKKIGSLLYEPKNATCLISTEVSQYYFLSSGYYLICPFASSVTKTNGVDFMLRTFSYDHISMDELDLNENMDKFFVANSNSYVGIISQRCNLCDKLLEGPYVISKEQLIYHNECYEKLSSCQNCHKIIKKTYYTQPNGFKFCQNCDNESRERINSAKAK